MIVSRRLRHRLGVAFLLGCALLQSGRLFGQQAPSAISAGALSGSRVIDNGRLDVTRPPPIPQTEVPKSGAVPAVPAGLAGRQFLLTNLVIDGAKSVPSADLAATWQAKRGQRVSVAEIYAIAQAIGAVYAQSDIALYSVYVPSQPFDGTQVHIRVMEGYVGNVTIEGDTKGADLDLLRAYAAAIAADRPLHRSTLERYVLLMGSIAGVKVGSKLEALTNAAPGAVRLRLGVSRKNFEYGFGFNNQGASVLSSVQIDANAAVDSLFREGDRTQFLFGTPITIGRYQYYGLTHLEPIGTDGATLTATVGDLVTHPKNLLTGGNAVIASLQGSYPVILRTREALTATAGFDALNSNNALLGTTLSDERTRAVRLGANYAVQDSDDNITGASVIFSEGIDALGARRGGLAYGRPSFTKLNARLAREQKLPAKFVVRVRLAAQYTPDHLPASEQFGYGGVDFGQAFETATLFGDEAVAALGELAYRLPDSWAAPWLGNSEAFISADWARVWNIHTLYALPTDSGASGGVGMRSKIHDKVTVQLEAARVLQQPRSVYKADSWRFVVQVTGSF